MANYKGHIVGATIFSTAYIVAIDSLPVNIFAKSGQILDDWQQIVGIVVVSVLFGLWPDVDTNSKAQNIFIGLAFATNILLIAVGRFEAAAYLGLLAMTPIVGKHRGWTHSKLAMFLLPLPIVLVPYLYNQQIPSINAIIYGAAFIGYFSHLLLDGLIIKKIRVKN